MKRLSPIYYLPALLTLLVSSCSDFLGIKPKGELIPETAAEYETMLNSADVIKTGHYYPVLRTDDAYIPLQSGNPDFPSIRSMSSPNLALYSFAEDVFSDADKDDLYGQSYANVFYYNVIIHSIMDATESTEAQRRSLQAEALLGRALEYLGLVNSYAVHYSAASAATDLGVPLILKDDINQSGLTRATVAEVYEQIISDLAQASAALPDRPKVNAFRGSKAAATGLLARTYLYMGDYSKALEYALATLQVQSTLIDLNDYEVVDNDRSMGRINVPARQHNPENIYIRLAPYVFGNSGEVYLSQELRELFGSEQDRRLALFFAPEPYGVSLNGDYLYMPYIEINHGIATPEMYLIAAECEARLGQTTQALLHLNALRSHRIADYQPITTTEPDQLLREVLNERRRELAMVGSFRLIDLKRLNQDPRFAKNVVHTTEQGDVTLEPNSPRYVLQFPNKVMRMNEGSLIPNP